MQDDFEIYSEGNNTTPPNTAEPSSATDPTSIFDQHHQDLATASDPLLQGNTITLPSVDIVPLPPNTSVASQNNASIAPKVSPASNIPGSFITPHIPATASHARFSVTNADIASANRSPIYYFNPAAEQENINAVLPIAAVLHFQGIKIRPDDASKKIQKLDPMTYDMVNSAMELFYPETQLLRDFDYGPLGQINTSLKARISAKNEIIATEGKIKEAESKIFNIEKEISAIERALKIKKNELERLPSTPIQSEIPDFLKPLQQKIELLESQLSASTLPSQISEILNPIQRSIQALESELSKSSIPSQVPVTLQPMQMSVQSLNKAVSDLTIDLLKLQKQLGDMDKENTENNAELLSKEGQLDKLKLGVISSEKPSTSVKMTPETDIINLELDVRALRRKIEAQKPEYEKLVVKIRDTKHDLNNATEKLELKLENHKKELKEELIRWQGKMEASILRSQTSLERDQKKLEKQLAMLNANINEWNIMINSKQEKIASHEATIVVKAEEFQNCILVDAANKEDYVHLSLEHIETLSKYTSEVLLERLCDITQTTNLPYLTEVISQARFDIGKDYSIKFNGRELMDKFSSKALKNLEIRTGSEQLNLMLYGTIGCGKSHMLLALASYLMSRGERVIYFAYAICMLEIGCWGEKLLLLVELEKRRENPDSKFIQDIYRILNTGKDRPIAQFLRDIDFLKLKIYIIVDQFDTLNLVDRETSGVIQLYIYFFANRAVLASSANDKMAHERWVGSGAKYSRLYFDVLHGYTDPEFKIWWEKNTRDNEDKVLEGMNEEQLSKLKLATGQVPLYLNNFLKADGQTFESKFQILEQGLTSDIWESLRAFYSEKNSSAQRDEYIRAARYCLAKTTAMGSMSQFIHNRYYNISTKPAGSCCGIAENLLISKIAEVFREFKIMKDELLTKLSKESDNSQAGNLLEQIGKIEVYQGFVLPEPDFEVQFVESNGTIKYNIVNLTSPNVSGRALAGPGPTGSLNISMRVNNDDTLPTGIDDTSAIAQGRKKTIHIKPTRLTFLNHSYDSYINEGDCQCFLGYSNHPAIDSLVIDGSTCYGINYTKNKYHKDTVPRFVKDICSLDSKIQEIGFIWWAPSKELETLKTRYGSTIKTKGKGIYPGRKVKMYFIKYGQDVEKALAMREKYKYDEARMMNERLKRHTNMQSLVNTEKLPEQSYYHLLGTTTRAESSSSGAWMEEGSASSHKRERDDDDFSQDQASGSNQEEVESLNRSQVYASKKTRKGHK